MQVNSTNNQPSFRATISQEVIEKTKQRFSNEPPVVQKKMEEMLKTIKDQVSEHPFYNNAWCVSEISPRKYNLDSNNVVVDARIHLTTQNINTKIKKRLNRTFDNVQELIESYNYFTKK